MTERARAKALSETATERAEILDPREIALSGVFGAAALLLPVIFHLVQLGRIFMPMYLPLVALAFFVRPAAAATTALVTPFLSALLTAMPPLYPPIAPIMALELALMATLIAGAMRRWPRANPVTVLIPVLLVGRLAHVAMILGMAAWLELPSTFVGGLSLLSGWPGVVLMIVVVPGIVLAARQYRSATEGREP